MQAGHDDVIHADFHGAVVVPADAVKKLPAAIDLISRREKVILDVCRAPDFTAGQAARCAEALRRDPLIDAAHRHPQRRYGGRLGCGRRVTCLYAGADVAFEDGVLRFVGRGYDGTADETISGSGLMVMPGLVNIHSHPSSEPMNKGCIDEIGSPGLYNSSLYEYLPILRADAGGDSGLRARRAIRS